MNLTKTKVMKCQRSSVQSENAGKWPCSVCHKGVGRNSIRCNTCKNWVHKKCSGVKGKLLDDGNFKCSTCTNGLPPVAEDCREISLSDGAKLECVSRFCYLGDMLGEGGGCEEALRTRVKCAWGKFRELAPVLTSRGASFHQEVHTACYCIGMLC